MTSFGFVYIWRDRKNGMFYLGSHMGPENDGYICSSRWMRAAYKKRPEDFKRRILARVFEKNFVALRSLEASWLALIKTLELGRRYYNHSTCVWIDGSSSKTSDESREQRRLAIKETSNTEAGRSKLKKASAVRWAITGAKDRQRQIQIEKMSSAQERERQRSIQNARWESQEERDKQSLRLTGLKRSNETRERLRAGRLGKKHSAESLRKIGDASRNRHPDVYIKIGLSNKGRKPNQKQLDALVAGREAKKGRPSGKKGQPMSVAHAAALERARVGRWANHVPKVKVPSGKRLGRPRLAPEIVAAREAERQERLMRPRKHTLEARAKRRASALGRKGRHHTEADRAKMRQGQAMRKLFRQQHQLDPKFLTPSAITAGLIGMVG